MEKGPVVLCVRMMPNSKPDIYALNASGMSINTDTKMTEQGVGSKKCMRFH